MDDLTELENDIYHDWWTVVGFWMDTWERWADHFDAPTPRMAEDLAMVEANSRGRRLAVIAVFEGQLQPADEYAVFVNPDIEDPADMEKQLRAWGYDLDN